MSDGHVIQEDVEVSGTCEEHVVDHLADGFSLGEQLGGVEAGHYRLGDLVDNRGQDALVEICKTRKREFSKKYCRVYILPAP